MNHDYTHCADYDAANCPKSCFRAQVTAELEADRENIVGVPISWAHFKDTKECRMTNNKCKWAQGEFGEICVNADCPMCADFCPVLVQPGVCRYEDRGKRTNADRIRAMTDEELAKLIAYACDCDLVEGFSCHGEFCDCILDWLKQEVEE